MKKWEKLFPNFVLLASNKLSRKTTNLFPNFLGKIARAHANFRNQSCGSGTEAEKCNTIQQMFIFTFVPSFVRSASTVVDLMSFVEFLCEAQNIIIFSTINMSYKTHTQTNTCTHEAYSIDTTKWFSGRHRLTECRVFSSLASIFRENYYFYFFLRPFFEWMHSVVHVSNGS